MPVEPFRRGERWECEIALPTWRIFRCADGSVPVDFIADSPSPPSAVQVGTVEWILVNQAEVLAAVLGAIRTHYMSVRPKYVRFARVHPAFMGDPDIAMPDAPVDTVLASLHTLLGLSVLPIVREGLAYVGVGFRATWEPEHGVGLMTHGRRVVNVGGMDASFVTDAAEDDAERGGT